MVIFFFPLSLSLSFFISLKRPLDKRVEKLENEGEILERERERKTFREVNPQTREGKLS